MHEGVAASLATQAGLSARGTTGNEPAGQPQSEDDPNRAEFGVLLVHGIGDQKRGETLLWVGESLYTWLQRWLNRSYSDLPPQESAADLGRTYLALQDPDDKDAPAHAKLWLRDAPVPGPGEGDGKTVQGERRWLLAESWWATTFPAASFDELVSWGLGIGPFMLQRVIGLPKDRLSKEANPDEGALAPLLSLSWVLAGILILVICQVVFPLAILALMVLQVIPPLSGLVTGARNALSGWLGDAYVIATSPLRTAAMVQQIQHDLDWLAGQGCKRVAILAHSGGAPIAYDALSDPRYEIRQESILFITYGSGKRKVDIMRQLLGNRTFLFALTPVLRGAAVLALLVGATTAAAGGDLLWPGLGLVGVALATIAGLTLHGQHFNKTLEASLDRARRESERNAPQGDQAADPPARSAHLSSTGSTPTPLAPFDNRLPDKVTEWWDYCAIADLVGEGAPGVDERHRGRRPPSVMVHNLDSLPYDHTTYWENAEEFVPGIVRRLFIAEGRVDMPGEDQQVLHRAARRRTSRVRVYFSTGLLSILATFALWMALGDKLGQIGGPIAGLVAHFLTATFLGGSASGQGQGGAGGLNPFWPTSIGMVLVALAVAAWQRMLLFPVWRWWSRQETIAMFERIVPSLPAPQAAGLNEWHERLTAIRTGTMVYAFSVVLLPILVLAGGLLINPLGFAGAEADNYRSLWALASDALNLITSILSLLLAAAALRTWPRGKMEASEASSEASA